VIEDLHWADDAFVAFLEHLTERTAGLPLLVVVTARPEVEERHPSWPPGRRSTVLSLSPLTDVDVETLITRSLPEADPQLIRIVQERAGGSPLYAEQLAIMLRERALPIAGGAVDDTLIPSSVQALIAARIDALPAEPKRVLMEASVVGKTFWSGAVASLGEHPDLEAALGELVRREFCRPVQPSAMEGDLEFGFWHALVRDVAYAELTKAGRARMHAATARWIIDRTAGAIGEDAEIVVHHLDAALELASSAPGLDTAPLNELLVTALLAAGEAAMRTDAAGAGALLERAMELTEVDSPGRAKASSLRGRSLHAAGRHEDALPYLRTALDAAVSIRDFDDAVPSAFLLSMSLMRIGQTDQAQEMLDGLGTELGSSSSAARASYVGGMAEIALSRGDFARAEALCDEGLAISEELSLSPPGPLLDAKGLLRISRGDLDGEAEVRQAVKWYLSEGFQVAAAGSLWNLGASLGDWIGTRASVISEEAIELCFDRGVEDVHSFQVMHMFDALLEGRWEELAGLPDLLRKSREVGNLENESIGRIVLGYAELERQGTLEDLDRLLELSETWDPSFWIGAEGASLLVFSGEPRARDAGCDLLRRIAEQPTGVTGHSVETRAAIAAGDLSLATQFASDPDDIERPFVRADACCAAAALAEARKRRDEAAIRYEQAVELWDYLGYSGKLPHERIGLGRCLIHLGRYEEGITRLREARAACEHLGARVHIAEIDELLASVD
jgi:tetratricopeptide (TPR) repeat protein